MQFEYLRKKAADGESFVVVGRCAETKLKDFPGLISFFILGDREKKGGTSDAGVWCFEGRGHTYDGEGGLGAENLP